MGRHRPMLLTTLRLAVIVAVCARVLLLDRPGMTMGLGLVLIVGGAAAAALALATEPRTWARGLLLLALVSGHIPWLLHDAGAWHHERYWIQFAEWTVLEACVVFVVLETRLWRGWPLLALALAAWLIYHLLPSGFIPPSVVGKHAVWLLQLLLLVGAQAGLHMYAEHRADEADDAPSADNS